MVSFVPITKNNSYFEEMIARGLKPNIFTYNSFVQASSDSWIKQIFCFCLFVWLVGGLVLFLFGFLWFFVLFSGGLDSEEL